MGIALKMTQQGNSMSPKIGAEWQDTNYNLTTTSDLYTQANAYGFTDAVFTATPTAPTITFATDACTRTPDVVLKFVMDSTEGKAIQTACDGDAADGLNNMFQLCNSNDIQNARSKTWN